ncbi:hypothetical protein V8G54_023879 [Vigna mungo]|uniref:Uncharacterized protein n=1 Tax=Vigna mungo TaxID=3915 RepID=A0AAQ3N698_VIGMU
MVTLLCPSGIWLLFILITVTCHHVLLLFWLWLWWCWVSTPHLDLGMPSGNGICATNWAPVISESGEKSGMPRERLYIPSCKDTTLYQMLVHQSRMSSSRARL